jgi:PiT family inorganic phosphate transporter
MDVVHVSLWAVTLLILLALALDFSSSFQDAADSIATVVSTGALKPQQAVVFAAFMNFASMFVFGHHVAATVATGIVEPGIVDHHVVIAALIGAFAWHLVTWFLGIPSSPAHALAGGLVGAVLVKAGTSALIGTGLWKLAAFILVSPALAFVVSSLLMVGVAWLFRGHSPRRVDGGFRHLQLVSAGLYALGRGGNDAQRSIGIVWMLLITAGVVGTADPLPPIWATGLGYVVVALGTLLGGWRLVKTMGRKIAQLKPTGGFCADTGAAVTLFLVAALGVPVSTAHTIAGAAAGAGSTRSMSAVRWRAVGRLVWAWVFAVPTAALIAAGGYGLARCLI